METTDLELKFCEQSELPQSKELGYQERNSHLEELGGRSLPLLLCFMLYLPSLTDLCL